MAKLESAEPSLAEVLLQQNAIALKQLEIQERQARATEALMANTPPRDINYGDQDYQERLRAETKTLTRSAFQNGFEVNPSGLSDETIDRLANLAPGTYLGGTVTVALANDAVHLLYKNRTPDQRMAFQAKVSSFSDMVQKIWAEMQGAA